MGNCQTCGWGDDEKVEHVFRNFTPERLNGLNYSTQTPKMIIGRVRLGLGPDTQAFFSPGYQKPCVYYKCQIQQYKKQMVWEGMDENRRQVEKWTWVTVFTKEKFSNFYVQDENISIYIPATSKQDYCRIKGDWNEAGNFNTTNKQAGYKEFNHSNAPYFIYQWMYETPKKFPQGQKYRFRERSFELNEMVAVLGIPMMSPNVGLTLMPLTGVSMSDEELESRGIFKHIWEEVVDKWKCVLVTDDDSLIGGFQQQVPAITGIPQNQTQFRVPDNPMMQQQRMMQQQPGMGMQQPGMIGMQQQGMMQQGMMGMQQGIPFQS